MTPAAKARIDLRDSDNLFFDHPRAFAWRVLHAELDRLDALLEAGERAFSAAWSKEAYAARAAVEDAIGVVVASLRADLAKGDKPVRVRKRGRPKGSRTRSPAEKDAASRTIPIPGAEPAPAVANGASHVTETAPQ